MHFNPVLLLQIHSINIDKIIFMRPKRVSKQLMLFIYLGMIFMIIIILCRSIWNSSVTDVTTTKKSPWATCEHITIGKNKLLTYNIVLSY